MWSQISCRWHGERFFSTVHIFHPWKFQVLLLQPFDLYKQHCLHDQNKTYIKHRKTRNSKNCKLLGVLFFLGIPQNRRFQNFSRIYRKSTKQESQCEILLKNRRHHIFQWIFQKFWELFRSTGSAISFKNHHEFIEFALFF